MVYFQPSNQNIDWFFNFMNAIPTRQKVMLYDVGGMEKHYIRIGKGYKKAFRSAETAIIQDITICAEQNKTHRIKLCGHSYGGGICINTLISVDKYFSPYPDYSVQIVTFGDPKVIYGEKSKEVLLRLCPDVVNYGHVNDIVTKVVPWAKSMHRVTLGGKGKFKELFNPLKWHLIYGDDALYEGESKAI